MSQKYVMITIISNLSLTEKLNSKQYEIFSKLDENFLKKEFDVDFEIMNFFEREAFVSSPVLVRYFEADDDDKAFSSSSVFIFHLVNILALFQPSIIYIERGPLFVKPIIDGKIGPGKGDLIPLIDSIYREKIVFDTRDYEDFENFFRHCYD